MKDKHWGIIINVLIEKGVDVSCVTMTTKFTDLGLDSLDVFSIVVNLEKKYSIKFADEEITKVVSISDALSLLGKYIQ